MWKVTVKFTLGAAPEVTSLMASDVTWPGADAILWEGDEAALLTWTQTGAADTVDALGAVQAKLSWLRVSARREVKRIEVEWVEATRVS